MNMVKEISLIIPSQDAETNLVNLLKSIPDWEVYPNEIIVIDSSKKKFLIPEDFKTFTKKHDIKLIITHGKRFYPGHARNIGIKESSNSLLAFLDTSTYPSESWLSSSIDIMSSENTEGVWGNTYYKADKYFPKIFRACTYGAKPIKTFPGSIFKKDIFNRCGLFIESTRAGEDGDWMSRADLQEINMSTSKKFLIHNELNRTSFIKLLRKWFRNHVFGAKLPFFRAHKDYYYYALSFVAVVVALNWNWILASWDEESIFFVPNITKISILIIFIIYIFMRGIFLPQKKGVNLAFIFPVNFILIAFLSGFLDLTKALAFAYSKLTKT